MAKERVVVTEEELERLLAADPKFAVEMVDSDLRDAICQKSAAAGTYVI